MGILDHANIFTRKFKTRKFFNTKIFQIYGSVPAVRCGLLAKWLRVKVRVRVRLGLGPGNALVVFFGFFFVFVFSSGL